MSVTLISPPPAYSFSRDQLKLQFQCADMMETVGANSLNRLFFNATPVPVGTIVQFKYGSTTVVMTAANVPDLSGTQFSATTSDLSVLLANFKGNYTLSNDFEIYSTPGYIYFKANKQSTGFNVTANSSAYHTLDCTQLGSFPKERANYAVVLRLYCETPEGETYYKAYEHNLPVTFGSGGIAEINIGDKLHDYISAEIRNNLPDIPEPINLFCKKSCRKYYFEYGETFGSPQIVKKMQRSADFTVLHGGFSSLGEATKNLQEIIAPSADRAKDRFLKQGPLEVLTRADQPQYLYFFNTREMTTVIVNCRFYFTDGSIENISPRAVFLPQYQKFGYNVRFDTLIVPDDYPTKKVRKYEIWLTNNTTGAVISESRFYVLDYEYRQYYKYFLNWSSWGTMDTRMFYGKGSVELDLVQFEADKVNADPKNITQGTSIVYDITGQTKFSVTTGFIENKTLLLFNRDFFLSAMKYVAYNGMLLPIKVTSKTIPEYADGENLFAQKFDWQYLFDDHAFTEGDVYQAPVITPPPVGQVYFGSAVSRPLTALQVKALGSQSPDVYLFPLATGLNRFFIVATPPGKAIGNVYSQTTDENLTSEFIPVNMAIDGLTYGLSVMEMDLAFSISNTLIISLIDVE